MQMLYSATTRGFYCQEVHADGIPPDAVEISDELYAACAGQPVHTDENGLPALYVPPPLTDDEKRAALKEAVTQKRFEVEVGGLTLPSGEKVGTDRDDQNSIANAISVISFTGLEQIDFKAADGWVTLTVPQLQAIAAAVGMHKQACFSAERAHHAAIDALASTGLDSYDIQAGWPTN